MKTVKENTINNSVEELRKLKKEFKLLNQKYGKSKSDNRLLTEAIKYYADESNYCAVEHTYEDISPPRIDADKGYIARQSLGIKD